MSDGLTWMGGVTENAAKEPCEHRRSARLRYRYYQNDYSLRHVIDAKVLQHGRGYMSMGVAHR